MRKPQGPGQVLEIAGWLAAQVPGLAAGRAEDLVVQATGRMPRRLLEYVSEHPAALTDPAPLLPASAVRLAHALRREGHAWVVLPSCARCGSTPADLRNLRPEGRICYQCNARERSETCVRCGLDRPVHARAAGGPVCATCHERPALACEVCGRVGRLSRRAGPAGPAACYLCARKERIRTCSACGRQRPASFRQADGREYCHSCYPHPPQACARCGKLRTVTAEWPIGPVCPTCYSWVRRKPLPCPQCGQVVPLVAVIGTEPTCGPCAGWDNSFTTCLECGAQGLLDHGYCFRCILASVLDDLLAGASPANADQLRQLADALLAVPDPYSTVKWLRRTGRGLIAGLTASGERLTHGLLDQMPHSDALHYLRDRLVVTGVLPERAEYIERIPAWTARLLTGKPEAHARIIRAYAQWDALHRARRHAGRRPDPTRSRAGTVRAKIKVAADFLDWLDARETDLASVTQPSLELWLLSQAPGRRVKLGPFLSWARQRRLCGELTVPHPRPGDPLPGLDHDERWQHLLACLDGSSPMPLSARAAVVIALLYGVQLTRVARLRTTDIIMSDDRPHLLLGSHPMLLFPAVASLISQQAAQAAASQPAGPEARNWLFPGRDGLRPSASLGTVINRHGISIRDGRRAALVDLAGQLPAGVLAEFLGIAPATAEAWSRRMASDWAAYVSARAKSGKAT
jgi:hypothetical protein